MVLAIAQTLFECSMYIFVLLYTPAIESVAENSNHTLPVKIIILSDMYV